MTPFHFITSSKAATNIALAIWRGDEYILSFCSLFVQ
jgi:hypothetical protein